MDSAAHGQPYAIRHSLEVFGSIVRRDRPLSGSAASFLALLGEGARA